MGWKMEDKHQLLSHAKTSGKNETPIAGGPSCSPVTPTTRSLDPDLGSPDLPITRSPDHQLCSPDHPLPRSPGSKNCRECLGALAHRLAQTMTALRGGIELGLMGKHSTADYRSLLERSLELADTMAQLIVSIRDLGESGAPGGPPEPVLLEAAASEVLGELEGLAEFRELHLQLKTEGAVKVFADPVRLREVFMSLLAWVIQNSAGGTVVAVDISAAEGEARVVLSPSRQDLQYLQVKILEDITSPGLLFSYAAKNGALGWIINLRLVEGLGGKLEILNDGSETGRIRARFPLAPAT